MDPGAQLAARLPPGANRCAVARPYLVPRARRGLVLRMSQADALPWVPGAPIASFASADRVGPDGRRSSVALVRTTADPATVRRWLEEHAPVRARFEGRGASDEGGRAFSARFVDAHTLRLQLGPWPVTSSDGPGAEARCASLAREFPEAAEVASRHGEVVVLGASAHLPRRTDLVLVADDTAVTITRHMHMASADQAEDRRLDLDELDPYAWSMAGDIYPERVDHTRRRHVLSSRMRILWEDLVLAAQDQRRMAAAIAEDERQREPRRPMDIDVSNLAVARSQIGLWTQRVAANRGALRRASAEQLAVLLERAIDAHPSEVELARQLARLSIDELADAEAAIAITERVLATTPPDVEEWRILRREAHAALGPEPLARVLAEDGVVAAAAVQRAAADLAALLRQGVDYEFAEGAWVASREIESRADRLRLRDVAHARLPIDSFVETFAELAEIGSPRQGATALYVLARGERSEHRLLWNPETTPVVEVGDTGGARRLVGVASTGDERLRSMGRSIADGFVLGPIELAVFVVPIDGSPAEPQLVLRLAGTLESDAFVLEQASGGAARVPWREVARLLADPLADLEPRVFPPPELEIDVASEREARRLSDLAAEHGYLRCARVDHHVRCQSSPEAPSAAAEVLRRFVREHLLDAARAMARP